MFNARSMVFQNIFHEYEHVLMNTSEYMGIGGAGHHANAMNGPSDRLQQTG